MARPTRDPNAPGFVKAKELFDGAIPPATEDGNFVVGPAHPHARETGNMPELPQGTTFTFTMQSTDSSFYPGINRGALGTADPSDPTKIVVTTSHPRPYTRHAAVFVPKQYVPGAFAPFIVGADGIDNGMSH